MALMLVPMLFGVLLVLKVVLRVRVALLRRRNPIRRTLHAICGVRHLVEA